MTEAPFAGPTALGRAGGKIVLSWNGHYRRRAADTPTSGGWLKLPQTRHSLGTRFALGQTTV